MLSRLTSSWSCSIAISLMCDRSAVILINYELDLKVLGIQVIPVPAEMPQKLVSLFSAALEKEETLP